MALPGSLLPVFRGGAAVFCIKIFRILICFYPQSIQQVRPVNLPHAGGQREFLHGAAEGEETAADCLHTVAEIEPLQQVAVGKGLLPDGTEGVRQMDLHERRAIIRECSRRDGSDGSAAEGVRYQNRQRICRGGKTQKAGDHRTVRPHFIFKQMIF